MNLKPGDILLSRSGEGYRVVECQDQTVSLIRMNGYTLFSCHLKYVEMMFIPASTLAALRFAGVSEVGRSSSDLPWN